MLYSFGLFFMARLFVLAWRSFLHFLLSLKDKLFPTKNSKVLQRVDTKSVR